MYRFDEHDPACRRPLGALPQGGTLSLALRYRRGFCRSAVLLWKIDGGTPAELPMTWNSPQGGDDLFTAEITPPSPGLYWYWYRIATAEGSFVIDRGGPKDETSDPYQLTVYDNALQTPDWIKGGVMYHIFVDRFAKGGSRERAMKPGSVLRDDWGGMPVFLPDEEGIVRNNDFFGGNLQGILDRLPYLQAQGVTCLYLSPVFEADSTHKYDTGDYMRVDAGFGDEAALKKLCREGAARGMRVILDGVFSHTGTNSVYFNRYGLYEGSGAYQSKESPYYPWFKFSNWPEEYECWWGIELLPAVNKEDPSYREFVSGKNGVIEHWMDCGIGGWRLDVADELPDGFLDPLCAAVRGKRADALIVGEVWEDASNKIAYGRRRRYLLGGQLDSVMNYPIRDAVIAFIREKNAGILADTMANLIQNYPKPILDVLMNILGTHDTMRILTVLGGDTFPATRPEMALYRLTDQQRAAGKQMLKIAAALQFTLPGFPCVYYGDEAGMEGGADPFNRVCFPWGAEDKELTEWYRLLASIRRSLPVFREGAYRLAAAREGVFAFTRGAAEEAVLVAVNLGDGDFTFQWKDFNYNQIEKEKSETCVVHGKSAAIYSKGRR